MMWSFIIVLTLTRYVPTFRMPSCIIFCKGLAQYYFMFKFGSNNAVHVFVLCWVNYYDFLFKLFISWIGICVCKFADVRYHSFFLFSWLTVYECQDWDSDIR